MLYALGWHVTSAREVAKDEKHLAVVGVRLHSRFGHSSNMKVACYSNYLRQQCMLHAVHSIDYRMIMKIPSTHYSFSFVAVIGS